MSAIGVAWWIGRSVSAALVEMRREQAVIISPLPPLPKVREEPPPRNLTDVRAARARIALRKLEGGMR